MQFDKGRDQESLRGAGLDSGPIVTGLGDVCPLAGGGVGRIAGGEIAREAIMRARASSCRLTCERRLQPCSREGKELKESAQIQEAERRERDP
jgi:hypothetical protein